MFMSVCMCYGRACARPRCLCDSLHPCDSAHVFCALRIAFSIFTASPLSDIKRIILRSMWQVTYHLSIYYLSLGAHELRPPPSSILAALVLFHPVTSPSRPPKRRDPWRDPAAPPSDGSSALRASMPSCSSHKIADLGPSGSYMTIAVHMAYG